MRVRAQFLFDRKRQDTAESQCSRWYGGGGGAPSTDIVLKKDVHSRKVHLLQWYQHGEEVRVHRRR